MNETAITVDAVSKKFRIGLKEESYRTFRDTLANAFCTPFRKAARMMGGRNNGNDRSKNEIWGLKDVSFRIKPGEIVGIIGRNGAGKSTLLKILSRITEPTHGFAEIRGKVGSLLEVGTGFHSELTGRENIYLSGAILGMGRQEIKRKFDEIIAFSEVDKFVDTPVKHFSSGMYLRLAFAVAAHLNPEILIVDEVLAVGDARFQEKCLNKMDDIGQKGRTVLFVSHTMPAVTRLCKRAILLEGGMVKADGAAHKVVNFYLNNGLDTTADREWPDAADAPGNDVARLRSIRIIKEDGSVTDTVDVTETFGIEMEYEVYKPGFVLMAYHHFFNEANIEIFDAHDTDSAWRGRPRPAGRYKSIVWIYGNLLSEGRLFISSGLTRVDIGRSQFYERSVLTFQVVESMESSINARGDWTGEMTGAVRPLFRWNNHFRELAENPKPADGGRRP